MSADWLKLAPDILADVRASILDASPSAALDIGSEPETGCKTQFARYTLKLAGRFSYARKLRGRRRDAETG